MGLFESWRLRGKLFRKAKKHWTAIDSLRKEGLWPAPQAIPATWTGRRVLAIRHDRFGDMMVSLPFLARLRASGAEVGVFAACGISRSLLEAVGLQSFSTLDAAAAWAPDSLLFLELCRHLRSARHGERWEFLRGVLSRLPGRFSATPGFFRQEAMSAPTLVGGHLFSSCDAWSLLDRFADSLGLPKSADPFLAAWIAPPVQRRQGRIVLNLSAGAAGASDRRDIPVAFWHGLLRALRDQGPMAAIVQPGDDSRRQEFGAGLANPSDCAIFSSRSIADVAAWLGQQRLLISPETGLCHLASNLRLPRVVLTPKKLAPFWYPPRAEQRTVFAKYLKDASLEETVRRVRELLG